MARSTGRLDVEKAVEFLCQKLNDLDRKVQEQAKEERSFRELNKQRYDSKEEIAELLFAASEKLWEEKLLVDERNFEEHSSDLLYLCRRFKTRLASGLPDAQYKEQLALMTQQQSTGAGGGSSSSSTATPEGQSQQQVQGQSDGGTAR